MSVELKTMSALVERLVAGLASGVPGVDGQIAMAPDIRKGWDPHARPTDARHAAVLILLYPRAGEPHLVLTERVGKLRKHGGQISLPGGAVDDGESAERAALREAQEEIGLDPSAASLRGRLSRLHIPVSGFDLEPVIATTDATPAWERNPDEVSRVIETPVANLADRQRQHIETWQRWGTTVRVPVFQLSDEIQVWGATAMILSELLTLLGHQPTPRDSR